MLSYFLVMWAGSLILFLSGEAIAYSACVKNLGIFMDDRFTWRNHVSHVRKNVNFVLSKLWHFAYITPAETRRRLVQSLAIISIL
jgi:hypothetical protein